MQVLISYFCLCVVCVFTCYLAGQLSPILGVASFTSAPPLRTFLHGSTFHIEAPVPKCLTVQNVNISSLANRRSTDWQTGLGAVHPNWIKIPPGCCSCTSHTLLFFSFVQALRLSSLIEIHFVTCFFQIFFSCLKQTMFKRTYRS